VTKYRMNKYRTIYVDGTKFRWRLSGELMQILRPGMRPPYQFRLSQIPNDPFLQPRAKSDYGDDHAAWVVGNCILV